MKRCFIQMVTIVLLCILVLSSCENNTSETLSVEFNDHLKKYYQVTENATQQVAFSSENIVFRESDLEI